jgi:Ca-activated chloride channel family protein
VSRRTPILGAAAAVLVAALIAGPAPARRAAAAPAASPPPAAAPAHALSPAHTRWLEDVALLITPAERAAFLALNRDYQRNAFIERFWAERDPIPETPQNELRQRWEERLAMARSRFPSLDDARAHLLLWNGEPAQILKPTCREILLPLEVWVYGASEYSRKGFSVTMILAPGGKLYRFWQPRGEGMHALLDTPEVLLTDNDIVQAIERACPLADNLLSALADSIDFDEEQARKTFGPKPGDEWIQSFNARTTDLPPGAQPLPARLDVRFPNRYQSRTVVEAVLGVARADAAAGQNGFAFLIDGEVLRNDELFDDFRYRFDLPLASAGDTLPLVIQRHLRPGEYTLIVRLEDIAGKRYFREERTIEVPKVDEETGLPAPVLASVGAAGARLAEAEAAAPTGDHTVRLYAPGGELHTGRLRVEATTTGEGIARVGFMLNGKDLLSKARPPWSVELDLGKAPRTHTLRATAFDAAGKELASDELLLNSGPNRFRVRLIAPARGGVYKESLRAEAAVELPPQERLERLEFYLNETRVATLFQPPFVQPILLPNTEAITYVRAVAYLPDGNSTEDLVFVNSPEIGEEVKIDFVELYATAIDHRGRPIDDLKKEDIAVSEEGTPQEVRRFERVTDLPIHAGVLIDVSTSMTERLADAVKAARDFFSFLTPRDRGTVVTFNEKPSLKVPFTNNPEVLADGLANLTADGETSIHDAVIYTLHYFSGLKGRRVLVLLTDGDDSKSKYSFEEMLDYARRTGVAIYTVGLALQSNNTLARSHLEKLAAETGGRSFFIEHAAELQHIYGQVREELHAQYVIAYQSSKPGGEDFRAVDVKVKRPGVELHTQHGYYP